MVSATLICSDFLLFCEDVLEMMHHLHHLHDKHMLSGCLHERNRASS